MAGEREGVGKGTEAGKEERGRLSARREGRETKKVKKGRIMHVRRVGRGREEGRTDDG